MTSLRSKIAVIGTRKTIAVTAKYLIGLAIANIAYGMLRHFRAVDYIASCSVNTTILFFLWKVEIQKLHEQIQLSKID